MKGLPVFFRNNGPAKKRMERDKKQVPFVEIERDRELSSCETPDIVDKLPIIRG